MSTKEKVVELESNLPVEELIVRHKGKVFQIYPWLKGRLFHKMITGSEVMYKKSFRLYWNQFISIFYGFHNLFRKYDAWFFTSSIERRELNDKQEDKLFDFIGNKIKGKALIIELRLFKYFKRSQVASKYPMSKSFFMLFETIYAKLFLRKVTVEQKELLQKITRQVEDGIDTNWIVRKYLAQYYMMKFWLKILPNPKVVGLSVSYSAFGYIRAFKEAGIEVVEFQHGIVTKNHHAYFYAKQFDKIQFPGQLLTVGKKEISVFDSENQFPIENVTAIGSRIVDFYSDKKTTSSSKVPKIVFALQDGIMADKLLLFLKDLNSEFADKLEIIVQPRREKKESYLEKHSFVSDLNFSENDFYSTVVQCDLHSTVYSTTAIESLSLGVPNILINIDNQSVEQLGQKLNGNKFTKIVSSPVEFIQAMDDLMGYDSSEVKASNSMNIMPNYKTNIVEFFKHRLDVEG